MLAGRRALAVRGHRIGMRANGPARPMEDRVAVRPHRQGRDGDRQSKRRITDLDIGQGYRAAIRHDNLVTERGIIRAGHAGRNLAVGQSTVTLRVGARRGAGHQLGPFRPKRSRCSLPLPPPLISQLL